MIEIERVGRRYGRRWALAEDGAHTVFRDPTEKDVHPSMERRRHACDDCVVLRAHQPPPTTTTPRNNLVVDAETSARLGRIRQHGTSPELMVRRLLHSLGRRFRVHNRDLPGSPDVANRSRKWAIFVHGCFWHRHAGCTRTTTPSRNREFWVEKFETNIARDARVQAALREQGYRVLLVWECETQDARAMTRLRRRLQGLG